VARRVYFAFDYRDVFAVNQIRRAGQFVPVSVAGFTDASQWEKLKQKSPVTIERAINTALLNTSVTVVCIGERTATRRWVNFELTASAGRGNALLGVYLPGTTGYPIPTALTDSGAKVYQWNSERFGGWVTLAAGGR
jgi:MTH538 TIR-like domain (DUF1863)